MDFSKFKTSDWLKAGGGLLMLIAYFLAWWTIDIPGVGSAGDVSGSDYFLTGTVPWLILVAIGVLTVLAALDIFKLPASFPAPLIFLAASALAFLLILFRFFSDGFDYGGFGNYDNYVSRGAGLYLALVAAIAVLVGSFLGFKESGGNINDLKDMNKLKGQFGQGGTGAGSPPPPPGAYNPPPAPGGYSAPPPPPGAGSPPPPPPPPQ